MSCIFRITLFVAVLGNLSFSTLYATTTENLGMTETAPWQASWIWNSRENYAGYNDTIEARKVFSAPSVSSAQLRITADTRYRLYVNNVWVNDGPGRSWPHHYQYDVVDVAPYLHSGENELRIIAKFFGIGTFHQLPQEAGLLAQLDIVAESGETMTLGTDETWEVRDAPSWIRGVPKQSVQMGPFEVYDARLETSEGFQSPVIRHAAGEGPWTGLEARDCPLLTRIPFRFRAFEGTHIIKRPEIHTFIFPTASFLYPDVTPANNHVAITGLFASVVSMQQPGTLTIQTDGHKVLVDGRRMPRALNLEAGEHLLCCVLTETWGHWRHDTEIRVSADVPFQLMSPIPDTSETPWCFVKPPEDILQRVSDYGWSLMSDEERENINARLKAYTQAFLENPPTLKTLRENVNRSVRPIAADEYTEAPHFLFMDREIAAEGNDHVKDAGGLVSGQSPVIVEPASEGDIELIYDLGEQNVGYYTFDIEAEADAIVDIFGVEYITPEGVVQHTDRYRNGMRYICKEGRNSFTSLMRRSQRYLFITLRNQTRPIVLHDFHLVESTYPAKPMGSFHCSDDRLNRIWDISARTLKLCTEDTFTDCPLYEQTLWVGDARNEAIFGYTAFGSDDIARRCIRLAALSLDKHPLVLCQTPSTWETLLPAWSFLWGIMVTDYYHYSGDVSLLKWVYPYVIKNLRNAEQFSDERGLFSGPFWNMFDWSGIDDGHNTVLHNSMFVVGAIDAALECAAALNTPADTEWLRAYRSRLTDALNALWNDEKSVYPDSIHNDGAVSDKTSIHTVFLSLLYDIAPKERHPALIKHLLNPPEDMTRVGSPFAIMYLYEALEKMNLQNEIIKSIYEAYQPMLDLNATTVWESFASGTTGQDDFPTRSHTHAWSSAPIHFLNRIILGILPEGLGGNSVTISPRPNGVGWAKGATATIQGPVSVSWKIEGDRLDVTASAPKGTTLRFENNDDLAGLKITFNGKEM